MIFQVEIEVNASKFTARVGQVDKYHLIAIVLSVKYVARSLLRANRSAAVGERGWQF